MEDDEIQQGLDERDVEGEDVQEEETSSRSRRRPRFGQRKLKEEADVFQHNAWDHVEWTAEREAEAAERVKENSGEVVPPELQGVCLLCCVYGCVVVRLCSNMHG
eukprot:Colp12_sorted_trinity150504_noHs@11386